MCASWASDRWNWWPTDMKLEPGLAALHAVRMANSPRISSSVAACAAILRQLWLENIARLHRLAQLAGRP